MSDLNKQHSRLLEAVLFASDVPLTENALINRLPEEADLKGLLAELQNHYATRGVHLTHAGKTWAFRTDPELSQQINMETEITRKLGRATVETMAIIAYHQPVSRAEIEDIRGVSVSKGTLDVLLEAGWIRPRGRRKTPGRPMTWGVTDVFLDHFGLESAADLPGVADLKAAGLLDARPAIDIHRETADGELVEEPEDGDVRDLLDNPLDPDEGALENG